jgi:hypothetical protein
MKAAIENHEVVSEAEWLEARKKLLRIELASHRALLGTCVLVFAAGVATTITFPRKREMTKQRTTGRFRGNACRHTLS